MEFKQQIKQIKSEEEFINNFNNSNSDFVLYKENNILYLKSLKHEEWLPFNIDFSSNKLLIRKNQTGLKSELAKAIGIKKDFKPHVLDTTAGLGRDSFLIASLGCNIKMIERNPIIFILLNNAIENAKLNSEISDIFQKMTLINENSIDFLKNNKNFFDVIYIDPMFPKSNKTRLVKKEMQLFREIAGDDLDSSELLNEALNSKVKRIVVKRMLNSPYINNLKPNFEIKGTTVRFDIYLNPFVIKIQNKNKN